MRTSNRVGTPIWQEILIAMLLSVVLSIIFVVCSGCEKQQAAKPRYVPAGTLVSGIVDAEVSLSGSRPNPAAVGIRLTGDFDIVGRPSTIPADGITVSAEVRFDSKTGRVYGRMATLTDKEKNKYPVEGYWVDPKDAIAGIAGDKIVAGQKVVIVLTRGVRLVR